MNEKAPTNIMESDPATAAATALAAIHAPGISVPEANAATILNERLAQLGVNEDSGYIVQSLARRAVLLESMYLRLLEQAATENKPAKQGILLRSASTVARSQQEVLSALYRIHKDGARGDYLPLAQDLQLADDSRPDEVLAELGTRQVVEAEAVADEIYEAEFRAIWDKGLTLG